MARPRIKSDCIGYTVKQCANTLQIPVYCTIREFRCRRSKAIEIRSLFPFNFDSISIIGAGIRNRAVVPCNCHIIAAGGNRILPLRAADKHRNLIAAAGHLPGQPVLIGGFIHLQQACNLSCRCLDRAGGAIAHRGIRNTGGGSDGCGNRSKCVAYFIFAVGGIIKAIRRAVAVVHQVLHVSFAGI